MFLTLPNLKFTLKTETTHTFHFLNVNIKYDNNSFSTLIYIKPTLKSSFSDIFNARIINHRYFKVIIY